MSKIKAKDVNVFYGDKQALFNVSIDIEEKQTTALIGPSGCGKSTLLRCFNRMNDLIDICKVSGSILLDGVDILDKRLDLVVMTLTKKQIFLALGKDVPEGNKEGGKLIPNPNKKWSDVDPSFPNIAIEVLGPPPTSGTRDAFQELAIEGGCKTFPELKAIKKQDKKKYKSICRAKSLHQEYCNKFFFET